MPARVPGAVAELNLFDRIDYQDAYVVDTAARGSPEQWMRWFLEGAPGWFRVSWVVVFKVLGARFEPRGTADQVLGWKILQNGPALGPLHRFLARYLLSRAAAIAAG